MDWWVFTPCCPRWRQSPENVHACGKSIWWFCWWKCGTETRLDRLFFSHQQYTQKCPIRLPVTTTTHTHTHFNHTHAHTLQAGRDTPIKVRLLPIVDSGIWMLFPSSFELSPKHQISFSPVMLLQICSPLPTSDTPFSDGSYFIFYFGDKRKPLIYSLLWLRQLFWFVGLRITLKW